MDFNSSIFWKEDFKILASTIFIYFSIHVKILMDQKASSIFYTPTTSKKVHPPNHHAILLGLLQPARNKGATHGPACQ